MKGFYRAMMLLLVFCLCGAVIVGCGGDGTTETTGEETTAAGTENGSDVTTAPGTETERNTEGETTTDTEEVTTGLSDAENGRHPCQYNDGNFADRRLVYTRFSTARP